MCARDWSAGPLGPPSSWPQALKTAVRLALNAAPHVHLVGPQLIQFYSDASNYAFANFDEEAELHLEDRKRGDSHQPR